MKIPLFEHYNEDCVYPLGVEESVDADFAQMGEHLQGMVDSAKNQIKNLQEKLQILAKISQELPTIQEKFENFQHKYPDYNFVFDGMDIYGDLSLHVYTKLIIIIENIKIEPNMESNIQDFFGGNKLRVDKSTDGKKWWIDVQYNYGKET